MDLMSIFFDIIILGDVMKFEELREKYPTIIYDSYKIVESDESYKIIYNFIIPNLVEFNPTLTINKENIKNDIHSSIAKNIIFNIGMIELISYFKCTCSKNIKIKAGYLDEYQKNWFKKLYYYGLGEFMYINKIEVSEDDLLEFEVLGEKEEYELVNYNGSGNLVPIGGGKDSTVSLELLKGMDNTCFTLNAKDPHMECIEVSEYKKHFNISRTIDPNLIELNKQGFLNGHTPFSSLVAFVTYLCAYLNNNSYIVLSNEASANEATVIGTKINHQYSKTYEFENDFNEYTKKYFNIDIKYFSLLRPLTEYQIGFLFSQYEQYHKVFKSCNVGSKSKPWVWCCNCPKCLFVYCILSPFLYKDKLINIFGEDLFEREDLLNTFIELLGYSDTKPFECVGTYSEVRYAISILINKLGDNLPYLLNYYKEHYNLELEHNFLKYYNEQNNLDSIFEKRLKEELEKYV